MTIQQIKYAIEISKVGSVNKASEKLYISQPSLSAAIKDLENELGFAIFVRTSKGVKLTNDGTEFIKHAYQVYSQYESLIEKYSSGDGIKKKFGVSCQHYSFAVKSFVEMVKNFDRNEYEFALRETKTREVIEDVANFKSQIGIIYLSDFNRSTICRLLNASDLNYTPLIDCKPSIYLWKNHPLAAAKSINFAQLQDYPNLSFEQSDSDSFYFAEEIMSEEKYFQTIKVNDRSTMLNLMIGLNGYTMCSGIICEELNGDDCIAVPFVDEKYPNARMEIVYITKKGFALSTCAEEYIKQLKKYLNII